MTLRSSARLTAAVGAALLAAGCSASTASTAASASTASKASSASTTGNSSTAARDAVPATAYLSVVQRYFPGVTLHIPGPESASYAVTDKQVIARLAALINAVPIAPEGTVMAPCPSTLGPAYLLDFRDSATAAPAAEVAILCFGVTVTVHGREEPLLSEGTGGDAQLRENVAELLGRHTPATVSPTG